MKQLAHHFCAATATAVLALGLAAANPALAATSDQQQVVDHSVGTLQDLRGDKAFGNARQLLHRARAILIAPRIFKAGFFFGGEGGQAALLVRGAGGWSQPAFYQIASASFGLQIGAKESEMIIFIMSDKALHAVMSDKFKIGANAGIAVATLGSEVGGATTGNVGADIIVWASSSGAFAGLSLDGSVIEPMREGDQSYYGRPVTTSDIVLRHSVRSSGAATLLHTLNGL